MRANGGASNAARRATGGRAATAGLGAFLSGVASGGLGAGLESIGLGRYVGAAAETVLAAIVDAITPSGATREEAAARIAIAVAFEELYARYITGEGGRGLLEGLSADDVRNAVTTSVAEYVYTRWLSDLGKKIEEGAVSSDSAVRMERDMHTYIRDAIILDMGERDPLKVKWNGEEGAALVEGLYRQAFQILEGGT